MGQAAHFMYRKKHESNDNLSINSQGTRSSLETSHSPNSSELEDSYSAKLTENLKSPTSQPHVPLEKMIDNTPLTLRLPGDSDTPQKQCWPSNPGVVHLPSLHREMYPPVHSFYGQKSGDLAFPRQSSSTETAAIDASSSDTEDDDDHTTTFGMYYDAMEEPSAAAMTGTPDFNRSNNRTCIEKQPMLQPPCDSVTPTNPNVSTSNIPVTIKLPSKKNDHSVEFKKPFITKSTLSSSSAKKSIYCGDQQQQKQASTLVCPPLSIKKSIYCGNQQQQQQQQKQASTLVCPPPPPPPQRVMKTCQRASALNNNNSNNVATLVAKETTTNSIPCQRKILPLPTSLRKKQIQPSETYQQSRPPPPSSPIQSQKRNTKVDNPVTHTKNNASGSNTQELSASIINKSSNSNVPRHHPLVSSLQKNKSKYRKSSTSSRFGNIDRRHGHRRQQQQKMNNNHQENLDLVTLPHTLDGDDWVCLFCQFQIFQRGWVIAQQQQKRTTRRKTRQKEYM